MIPLSKAVHKGFISFSYTYELWAIYEDAMTQKLKKTHVFACDRAFSSHRIKCKYLHWKLFMKGFISSSYTDELWTIYEDIVT